MGTSGQLNQGNSETTLGGTVVVVIIMLAVLGLLFYDKLLELLNYFLEVNGYR